MGLVEIQNALARLYTDSYLRERFIKDAANVGRELGLNEIEASELSKISPEELSFFSDSLVWKRLNEVEKLLPLTRKILREKFRDEFQSFADTYNPTGIKKHLEDAQAFCDYVLKKNVTGWQKDLIRFEQARLEFNGLGKRLLMRRFNFNVFEVMEKLSRDEAIEDVRKKKWCGVWYRLGEKNEGKFRRINL